MKKVLALMLALSILIALVSCEDAPDGGGDTLYKFQAGTVEIALHAPAEPILAALGEPKSYDESPSCAFEGLDKVYVYAGFQLQTYPKGGKDYIRSVSLTDDSVKTPEGIAIGATPDQVKQAYGAPQQETTTALEYRFATDCRLQFLLRDGKVTNIYYQYDVPSN